VTTTLTTPTGTLTWADLPDTARLALHHYVMNEDADLHPVDGPVMAEIAAEVTYSIETIPMIEFADRFEDAMTPEERADGGFTTWLAWYAAEENDHIKDFGGSRWPVIRDTRWSDSYLVDGHHRLVSYLRAGDTTITILTMHGTPEGD
jgi:hypothetical protein